MKKLIFNIVLISVLSGCGLLPGSENFPPEPDIEFYVTIENQSSHRIKIQEFRNGIIKYEHQLNEGEQRMFFDQIFEEDIPRIFTMNTDSSYLYESRDSSYVVYDDSISVLHTKQEKQKVSRSWLLISSYTGGKVNDKLYEIYYEFTDADYEEAVKINEGG